MFHILYFIFDSNIYILLRKQEGILKDNLRKPSIIPLLGEE